MKQCFLGKCVTGFAEFKDAIDDTLLEQIRHAQKPKAIVISCSDSRVDPALLFSCSPGDIFVVRNIANIVPAYTQDNNIHGVSAAIEYAMLYLPIKHIILLGHSNCGGINALYSEPKGDFIAPWISTLVPAKQSVEKKYPSKSIEEKIRYCEIEALQVSYQNLKSFPIIQKKIKENTLEIHTWFFNLDEASLIHLSMEEELSSFICKQI